MELHRLEIDPLTGIIGDIIRERSSGIMSVLAGHVTRRIHWAYGEIALVESDRATETLPHFLMSRGLIDEPQVAELEQFDVRNVAMQFTESDSITASDKLHVLRDWVSSSVLRLFAVEQGTSTFEDSDPLPPEQRVLVSTASVVIAGIRSIQSGLILRNSLGDLSRMIEPNPDPPFRVETLPLEDQELEIVDHLEARQTIQDFLRAFPKGSSLATRTVIALLTFGVIRVVTDAAQEVQNYDDTERDMAILASIAGDQNALKVLALSKQMDNMDHYKVIDVPSLATRSQISMRIEEMRKQYESADLPAAVGDAVKRILARIEEARAMLLTPEHREAYDQLIKTRKSAAHRTISQLAARRTLALQNIKKAENLIIRSDHYTALVLLRQAVKFEPDNAKAWHLLGEVQQENPKWRREAADSYMRSLSLEPNRIETMIALGDLYFNQKMFTRARNHYQEILLIDPVHETAQNRIKKLQKLIT